MIQGDATPSFVADIVLVQLDEGQLYDIQNNNNDDDNDKNRKDGDGNNYDENNDDYE